MTPSFRSYWRRLFLGLPTVLGIRRGGYFIPYRYLAGAPEEDRAPISWLETKFRAAQPRFQDLLELADGYEKDLLHFSGAEPPKPRWQQQWFPRLDGVAAYCLARSRKPGHIVEIGSGHSTRFFAAGLADGLANTSVEKDVDGGADGSRITAIDPAPRADLAQLPLVTLKRTLVQNADPGLFDMLRAGDFLAIDSSHIAMPGSDVDMLFTRVLPSLPAGVLVQIHDIFLPDPYPESWAWRGYNEQSLAAALLAGGNWTPIWSSRYVATRMADAVLGSAAGKLPHDPTAWESALWLEKTA